MEGILMGRTHIKSVVSNKKDLLITYQTKQSNDTMGWYKSSKQCQTLKEFQEFEQMLVCQVASGEFTIQASDLSRFNYNVAYAFSLLVDHNKCKDTADLFRLKELVYSDTSTQVKLYNLYLELSGKPKTNTNVWISFNDRAYQIKKQSLHLSFGKVPTPLDKALIFKMGYPRFIKLKAMEEN